MLRRLYKHQPDAFAFTPANRAWAELQMTKYPPGRQASAIIPLLWRAQEQEGWLSRPAIEHVADMLGLPYIRALEVATFYFMFQLHPVGKLAHVQVCGTLSCMLCGAEDLVATCRDRIAPEPHQLSADGNFSWEEVECLGACANAPMAQIGKDYYEDLTPEIFSRILDELAAGRVPVPGPQRGRFASEPEGGPTSLRAHLAGRQAHNASVALALAKGDTVRRIDGAGEDIAARWLSEGQMPARPAAVTPAVAKAHEPLPGDGTPASAAGAMRQEAEAITAGRPEPSPSPGHAVRPMGLEAPKGGKADDLKMIKGVGPKLEALLHRLGYFHFAQVAGWTAAEVAWVDDNLEGFRGRVSRDDWVGQARILAAGGKTEFSKRAKYDR